MLVGNDVSYMLMHLDDLSRRIRLEAFDVVTDKAWFVRPALPCAVTSMKKAGHGARFY